ncbi:hypothetical protein Egran_02991 [Elaphomyces granulatus]|uniref:Zn(2)-C6 fungal-type domain-containing protein n=1 Tax=Elaphomyces granulatus TaxID=519963 RepID=A0A232LYJ1_9EURO|nr:hypothetical protein Egran_02991 [Elaphomyces granulatus]
MAVPTSPSHSSVGENNEDDSNAGLEPQSPDHGESNFYSPAEETSAGTPKSKPVHPMQKRRRVTRACDECRRKKIKCDGKQPCTHCTVYSYDCTYDQPSNRRRNPAPQYIETLETRLHKAEALLKVLAPDISLDDPRFDTLNSEKLIRLLRSDKDNLPTAVKPTSGSEADANPEGGEESLLETMVESSGSLDRDDQGHWDYHGHSSGIFFIQRLRKRFGDLALPELQPISSPGPGLMSQILDSPKSQSESPLDSGSYPTHDLPPRAVAWRLCRSTLDHACVLMRFVHEPSFSAMFDRIYDTPHDQYTNEENTFLPLLYVVLAVGCLFSDGMEDNQMTTDYRNAIDQGFQYFKAGRQLLDITDCRDLTSIQAVCCMVLYLQSSASLSTCYSYVGIAQRAALRLGLHRSVAANFNPIERELRKRIFWVVRKMDVYVSTLLGLPQMVSDDDIDQEYPLPCDDEYITAQRISPMPPGSISLMAGVNAHTRLLDIVVKVTKYIYPVKNLMHPSKSEQTYMVSHTKIREIERDLQTWLDALPSALRPGAEASPDLERMRQLLRVSYAHVQMVMYRPFLHYVSQARSVDKRSYACAATCVNVSRNIIHITTAMHKKGLLNGAFWFTMYTTFFAVLSLVFYVIENPDSTARDGILKDAVEGRETLSGLAKRSLAADRCAQMLDRLFQHFPKLKSTQSSGSLPGALKRPTPSRTARVPIATNFVSRFASAQSSMTSPESSGTLRNIDESYPNPRSQPFTAGGVSEQGGLTADQRNPSVLSKFQALPLQQTPSIGLPPETDSNLHDMALIMFPSGDPLAYPAQPMSTLEDDHFKHDCPEALEPFSFEPSTSGTVSTPASLRLSTPNRDTFMAPLYGNGSSGGLASAIPAHFQHPNVYQSHYSPVQKQSPSSHCSTPGGGETVNSPDLVSIPSQNFMWPIGMPGQQPPLQPPSDPMDGQFDSLSMDGFRPMGMTMDMKVNLDDVLGDENVYFRGGGFGNDEYSIWSNPKSEDDIMYEGLSESYP